MTRWYDSTLGAHIEQLKTDKETTLRVDENTLVFATELDLRLQLNADETTVVDVALDAGIDRSQVLKMVKAHAIPGVTIMDLTKMDPSKLIRFQYKARAAMLEPLGKALEAGKDLESCLTSKSPNGFPAFLDLENYELVNGPSSAT